MMTDVWISAAALCATTLLGSLLGFAIKELPHKWNDTVLGYCAGVMLAAAILGLILPSVTSVFYIYLLKENFAQVPDELYYAAKVDGTSRRRVFTRITVPLLSPMLVYVLITGFIGGFKEYSSIVGIFGETMGPPAAAGRLNTMVGFIYDSLATSSQGKASAAALILFGIILVVPMINLQVSKKRVHY